MKLVPQIQHPLENKYANLSTRFEEEYGILWTLSKQVDIPCATYGLLNDLEHHHQAIAHSGGRVMTSGKLHEIRYSVMASLIPGVFNLGGQLSLFRKMIHEQNRDVLMNYATTCINALMPRIDHFGLSIITITLVQGDALGGGLEAALSSDIIIAEKGCQMGFPEMMFNLFPGMGAYSLVARKIGARQAEKMILSGKVYDAEELHEMGLVDVLAEKGQGEFALYDYIEKNDRRSNGFLAVQKARQIFNPVTYKELMEITTVWVDAALKLAERDLKVMDRFVRSQEKRFGQPQTQQPQIKIA
ncbi:MAG: crotonase/enoyl-CoA hydratase family protein [Gallionellaceae bacterium]|jgi:DSF synthase